VRFRYRFLQQCGTATAAVCAAVSCLAPETKRAYTASVLEKAQARTLPVLNQAVDLTPAVQACCGVCRSCVTTNVFTLIGAGVVTAGAYLARVVGRPFAKPA